MTEEELQFIAAQLRKPFGEHGKKTGETMNEGNLHINLNTLEALNAEPNEYILEIGMGNGFWVKDILAVDATIRYAGVDFSEVMVANARDLNAVFILQGRATLQLADAENLPFKDGEMDKVFSVNTLYFWENPAKVFAEIHRVLKPGGQLILAIRPKSAMEKYPFVKYGFQMFSKEELEALVGQHHFEVEYCTEKAEPEIELNGEKLQAATLLVAARK